MSLDGLLNASFQEPDDEEFTDKIKALKEILEDPPESLWNYEMIESIIIQYEQQNGFISKLQKEYIEEAYEQCCS